MDGDGNANPLIESPISQRQSNTGPLYDMRHIGETESKIETVCNKKETVGPGAKVQALLEILETDLYAADLKWSLFITAAHSYRCDTCLRPFPPQYYKDGTKNITGLREVLACVPSFQTLINVLREPEVYESRAQAIDLLYWVLFEVKEPTFRTVPKSQFQRILSLVPSEGECALPNLIFQVGWSEESQAERRWKNLASKRKTFFAFHGSRLENFYSIMNFGLLNSMSTKEHYVPEPPLFGSGIYLSAELSLSLGYSSAGYGWGGSTLGCQLSCVALCELIDHPDLKRKVEDGDPTRVRASDTMGGDVPPKYYLSQNSDLVQMRYLLVYTGNSPPPQPRQGNESPIIGWVRRNKLLTFMLGYAILLGSLGFTNSPTVQRYYRVLLKRWGM